MVILWSNGTTTRPGITLALGQYERAEWTADRASRVLIKRRWAEIWNGECVERLLEHESNFTHAEVDATTDIIALAEAWRADETYRDEQRREAIRRCSAMPGTQALVCVGEKRGMVVDCRAKGWTDPGRPIRCDTRNLCGIPYDLLEATGVSLGDKPAWAMPITWLSNKNRVLGYLAMKRMATEPEFLARVEAHGRLLLDMDGQRPPGSWAKQNNRLFGLEPST